MNILVTGGAGFVGSNLVKRLKQEGHSIVVLDNYSAGKHENEIPGVVYINDHTKNLPTVKTLNGTSGISKYDDKPNPVMQRAKDQ